MAIERIKLGRPKGSRNKRAKGDKFIAPLHRVFPKDVVNRISNLSQQTGISVKEVCHDMAEEGLTVLQEDVYKTIINFRAKRGQVIRERDARAGENDGRPEPAKSVSLIEETGGGNDSEAEAVSIFFDAVKTPEAPVGHGHINDTERPGQPGEGVKDSVRVAAGTHLTEQAIEEGIDTDLPL